MAAGSCSDKDHLHLVFGIMYLLFSLIASIGNCLLLYIVKRDPLRLFNKATNVFNIFLTINSLFSAVVVLPFLGIKSILQGQCIFQEPPYVAKMFKDVIVSVFVSNATLLTLALCIERSTAFVLPVLNRKHVTITRATRICTSITGTCLLVSCILFTGIPKNVFNFAFLPLFVLIPCQVLLVLPAVGFYGLKRQERKVSASKRNKQCMSRPTDSKKEKAKRNLQIYRFLFETTIFTICAVLILVFYCVVKFLEYSVVEHSTTPCFELLEHLSFLFLFLTVVVNPIVTVCKIPVYRRTAKHIWSRRWKV